MSGAIIQFPAIGTHWNIRITQDITEDARQTLEAAIQSRLTTFDRAYSRFRDDSLVAAISKKADTYLLPDDAQPMLDLYADLYRFTDGAFTPLVGKLLSDAGYDASYSLQPKQLTAPPQWNDVMTYRPPTLITTQPIQLDFGGLGKGYAIDLIGAVIEAHRITEYTIDAGGDIRHRSRHGATIRVGLEHPEDRTSVIGVATIANKSICGSAGNRRTWKNFHHIINPHELASPKHILATWAVAPTTLIADAMATCLFLTSPQKLLQLVPFEYLILRPDYLVDMSPHFPAELFTG